MYIYTLVISLYIAFFAAKFSFFLYCNFIALIINILTLYSISYAILFT